MQQHTVIITFDAAGNPIPLSHDGSQIETTRQIDAGDEIRWISPHGQVTVTFQMTAPFQDGLAGNRTYRSVSGQGSFKYHCAVRTADGISHGWPDKANGGGTVEVGRG